MIGVDYVRRMALYNRWQNENLYGAANGLTDEERQCERGAFFGSIHGTMCHLLWADQTGLSRFCDTPMTELDVEHRNWMSLKGRRRDFDEEIVGWAEGLGSDWLAGTLTYFSPSLGHQTSQPRWLFVSHFFNHQTHHRGQIHCMLTQAGRKPADTDLPMMPS
jgi:uncharacterized damage-inducible protein DinB